MKAPLFSIIIPTFNSAKTLAKCLESIKIQEFKDYEVVVIDANSTDSTIEIIKYFAGRFDNFRWLSESDNGVYDAMNKGVRIANGEWLYFLGSDDELFDSSVFSVVTQKIYLKRPRIVYGNVLIIGNCGWANDGQTYNGKFSLQNIVFSNICHQSIFYHRTVFQKVGYFNLKYKICADYDFNIRASAIYKFSYCDLVIAKFRGGGLSASKDILFRNDFQKIVIENHFRFIPLLNISIHSTISYAHIFLNERKYRISFCLFLHASYKKLVLRLKAINT
jgi:glycosyltransferase involved in cell wall biosynthesis